MQQSSPQAAKSAQTRRTLLDAAAQVIAEHGVANLTLERVAAAANISKGGLLYHYRTKQDLVVALLDDTLGSADQRLHELAAANGHGHGSFASAYLDFVRERSHDHGASAGVFAAAALDEGDLTPAREQFERWQQRLVNDDGLDETQALLARVVGDGLWLIDLFGLAPPSDEQRQALLNFVDAQLRS